MTTSIVEMEVPGATNVTVTEDTLTAELVDGHTLSVPLAWYPRLIHATPEERSNLQLHRNRSTYPLARPRRGPQHRRPARRPAVGRESTLIPALARSQTRRPPADARRSARARASGVRRLMRSSPDIPNGWRFVRLGDICDAPRYGANAPAVKYDPNRPRYVRITDITEDGRLKVDEPRCADPKIVEGYELRDGDLLFARSGSVGRTYLYRPSDGPCVYAGYLIRFRPDPSVALPRFLDIYTHSSTYDRWVKSVLHIGGSAEHQRRRVQRTLSSSATPLGAAGNCRSARLHRRRD